MKTFTVLKHSLAFAFIILSISINKLFAQACSPSVPSYTINLTGNPAGIWSSPNISRNSQCCGSTAPDQCVYFHLTLDPNTAGIQIDMIGADPAGSLFYDINCTGNYPGGTIKCISGVGPHQITFCKPGSNKNIYKITSISKPLFPQNDTVRIGCKHKLTTLGIVNNSVTWTSIYPGTAGQYNNYLDSTNVASPTYSPGTGAPAYVDYQVCGFPIASSCGFSLTVCDTVRIYNYPKLTASVTPNPATFCNIGSGSGVTLNGIAAGGLPGYTYTWKNSASVTVGTSQTYFATSPGVYNLEVKDLLYDPAECPASYTAVSVTQGTVPAVDAGASQKRCASNPSTVLNGSVQFASGGVWSGGTGTFTPGNTFLNTSYSPSAAELSAGFVKLYLTSSGAGGGCVNSIDSTIIYYPAALNVSIPSMSLGCYNGTTTLTSNVTGGTLPYSYLWNTNSTNSSISAGQGNYILQVTDSLGCSASTNINLISPTALNLNFNVSNVTVNGGNDGSVALAITGGNPAYTVTWSPGGSNSQTITGLSYGIYTATVTDANGCKRSGSTVVNEPRCLSFSSVSSATQVSCHGASNGVASVTVSGGTPPYIYTWNTVPSQTTSVANNLNAGVYSIVIEDANNCFQTANIVITEPMMLTNVMTHTDVSVIGGNNGAAAANPFGGTVPYSYLWSNGATASTATGLVAGSYSVTVTDNNNCATTDDVVITQPPCNDLTLNIFKNDVSCYGGSNGSALAVVTGASSYTLSWSNGTNGPSVNNLSAGNYSVMVTNGNNCTEYINFTIAQPSQLSIGLLPTNVSCNGRGNGSIDLTLSGGTYPYSFAWNNGSSEEDLVNLQPGTYSVVINDANGCSSVGSAGITQPSPFNITYTTQNVSCIYGANGAIGLNVTGGTLPFTYTWSTGANTSSIGGLTAGGYTVAIKDANNCGINQPLIIPLNQPDSVKVDSFMVACTVPGSNQTQVTVIPQGGNPGNYQVSFNNGTSYQSSGVYTALLNNNATYTILVKDAFNCVSLLSQTLAIVKETAIDSINYTKCYGAGTSTTGVTVYPSGGNPGTYAVSFNSGTNFLTAGTYSSGLAIANTYTVIVKDVKGCLSSSQIITLPSILSASANVTSNYNGQSISCFGLSNGTAFASAGGGSGIYTYTWNSLPTQTTQAAANLPAGTFSVVIADGNNCSITKTVILTEPAALTSTAQTTSNYNGQNISCFGLSDGSASVTATGGTLPYMYNWNSVPSQTSATASNLSAGLYSVLVTDINNCGYTTTVSLTQPAAMTSTASVISNYNGQQLSCAGSSDGSATIIAGNGTGPYTYTWSTLPVQTGTLSTNLSAGNYSVLINDANGCNITATITLSEPTALSSTISITSSYNGQAISCFGAADGSASVTVTGGTSPYNYLWNSVPTQSTSQISNISAGSYSVTVTDINGCVLTNTFALTQPAQLTASVSNLSNYNNYNVSCFGSTNGFADISLTGGTGAYTYSWSNSSSTQDLSGISAGNYSLLASDANGCTTTLSVTLNQPAAIVISMDSLSNYNGYNVSCSASTNGTVFTSVTGGVSAYTYVWSNGSSSQNLSNVSQGTYTLTVIDQNNCTVQTSTLLTEPPAITLSTSVINPLCNGVSNGSINVTLNGGVAPFTYSWSNGAATEDLMNISAGTYTLIYTDNNSCQHYSVIELSQPQAVTLTKSISAIKCYGDTTGSISVQASGGTLPYSFLWSNGATVKDIVSLSPGTYIIKVTDANGCISEDTTLLTQPDQLQLSLTSPLQFDGHNISFPNGNDGSIYLAISGGVSPYTYLWSNSATDKDLYNISAGTYSVIVTDNNSCRIKGGINLSEPLILEMPSGYSPNGDGKNDLFVVHGIEAYPSNTITIFNRWGNIVYTKSGYNNEWNGVSQNGLNLPDATYFVILEINGGEKVLKGFVELRR